MAIKWRKLNNALHRDIGYFFFGMTLIYGLSGIALNHLDDWDPSYAISRTDIQLDQQGLHANLGTQEVQDLLRKAGIDEAYKQHYYPGPGQLKVFLDGGTFSVGLRNGRGVLETVRRRPVFFEANYLHYNNPKFLWTWFSDAYAAALILMAVTGLFILRGKNGFRRRGIWFVAVGVLIPAVFLVVYYSSL